MFPTPYAASDASEPAAAPVVIVGAGIAGLTVALHLADRHPVVLLAKRGFDEAATTWAQGG
ncbi:MAG TPA: FAD-dependent oxidoreductase, partial [Patescibacteria group bacterium]|nr:FAD-dependent oxidoreductase [Patescibacteria group bacterium]